MRRFGQAVLILLGLAGSGRAETFDAATYTPPPGMALVARDADRVVYEATGPGPDRRSRIELYRLQPPKGSIAADFGARWQALEGDGHLTALMEPETFRTMTYRTGIAREGGRARYVALVTIQSGTCIMAARHEVTPITEAEARASEFIDFILGLQVTEQPTCGAR